MASCSLQSSIRLQSKAEIGVLHDCSFHELTMIALAAAVLRSARRICVSIRLLLYCQRNENVQPSVLSVTCMASGVRAIVDEGSVRRMIDVLTPVSKSSWLICLN